jgi:hypothetical protein
MRRSGSALTVCGPCRRAWPVPRSGLRVGLSGPEEMPLVFGVVARPRHAWAVCRIPHRTAASIKYALSSLSS